MRLRSGGGRKACRGQQTCHPGKGISVESVVERRRGVGDGSLLFAAVSCDDGPGEREKGSGSEGGALSSRR